LYVPLAATTAILDEESLVSRALEDEAQDVATAEATP
jgi:hypothetical protein